jgi:hypothetical protein
MQLQNSESIKVSKFEYIKLEEGYKNIENVMAFCGLNESDRNKELEYFNGGDVFVARGADGLAVTIGDDSSLTSGDYLIRSNQGLFCMQGELFNRLFEDI